MSLSTIIVAVNAQLLRRVRVNDSTRRVSATARSASNQEGIDDT
jgi:hypothetical protein